MLEIKLISEISLYNKYKASDNCLGNHSTKNNIQDLGLWQVNELFKEEEKFKDYELMELINMVKQV